jgi:hypothetical protein
LPNYIVVVTAAEGVGQKIRLKKAPFAERGLNLESRASAPIPYYHHISRGLKEVAKIDISQGRVAQTISKFKTEKMNNPPIPESLQKDR